jgi:hypothetical protein
VSAFPFSFSPARGTRHSLSARGQFLNTFAGIGFSVAFSLFALGGYLIQTQFDDPIQAQSVSLLVAALSISTAITLLYCLLHPHRKLGDPMAYRVAEAHLEEQTLVVLRSTSRRQERKNTQLPRRYVDRTRVYIQR